VTEQRREVARGREGRARAGSFTFALAADVSRGLSAKIDMQRGPVALRAGIRDFCDVERNRALDIERLAGGDPLAALLRRLHAGLDVGAGGAGGEKRAAAAGDLSRAPRLRRRWRRTSARGCCGLGGRGRFRGRLCPLPGGLRRNLRLPGRRRLGGRGSGHGRAACELAGIGARC